MAPQEKQLLENLLDSLDRLFDRNCEVYDLFDLFYASNIALKSLNSKVELGEYVPSMHVIVKSDSSHEEKRKEMLNLTNELRSSLSDSLHSK